MCTCVYNFIYIIIYVYIYIYIYRFNLLSHVSKFFSMFFNSQNKEVISINNLKLMVLCVTYKLKFKYTDYLN